MTKTARYWTAVLLISAGAFAQEFGRPGEVKIISNESGFILCTGGGTSIPLFSKDCRSVNLYRITAPGGIKYEGTCLDSGGTNYYLACESFNFEYNRKFAIPKQDNPQ